MCSGSMAQVLISLILQGSSQDLLYIGSLKVGRVGDSSILDRAILRVIQDQKKVHHSVALQLQVR